MSLKIKIYHRGHREHKGSQRKKRDFCHAPPFPALPHVLRKKYFAFQIFLYLQPIHLLFFIKTKSIMKTHIHFLLMAFLSITILATQQSCDKCKNVDCQNGGTCDKGKCICPTGYSGVNCEIKDNCYGVTCQNGGTCADGKCNCRGNINLTV